VGLGIIEPMTRINLVSCLIPLALLACQNSDEKAQSSPDIPTHYDITLRATSDIMAPAPIIGGTVVPNSVASWLGHLILLDEDGRLHRATTDSSQTETVALGKYKDVAGLARVKNAGIFFALDQRGNIKGFIEADDEGNFAPLAMSYGDLEIERFCHVESPEAESIKAITSGGEWIILEADIFENTSVTLSQEATSDTNCPTLFEAEKSTLAYQGRSIGITNGLSIAALKTPGFTMSTQANMGSVYSGGLIIVADGRSGRVVLISRDYFMVELDAQK